jgi:integrase
MGINQLTEIAVRGLQPAEKRYLKCDGRGLFLAVNPQGAKSWLVKYKLHRKEQRLSLGRYPDVSLKSARALHDDVRRAVRAGYAPVIEHGIVRGIGDNSTVTFEQLARDWMERQRNRWKPVHASDVERSLERDVFGGIGHLRLCDILHHHVIGVLRVVENRDALETASRVRQRLEAILDFAVAEGHDIKNFARIAKGSMKQPPKQQKWPACTRIADCQQLLADAENAGASPIVRLASRFLALTAQRPGMISNLTWDELFEIDWDEDSDCPNAIWMVPTRKLKQGIDLPNQPGVGHLVPLVKESVAALRAVRKHTLSSPFVFCSAKSTKLPMSENALNQFYKRIGAGGRHVPHGWRASFSSIMNEEAARQSITSGSDNRAIADRVIIDHMLAHIPRGVSATEFRYNRALHLERRREIAKDWASMLLVGAKASHELLEGPRRTAYR